MQCATTRITWELGILESLPSGGQLELDVTTIALYGSKEC
jgi:hypothetical protein